MLVFDRSACVLKINPAFADLLEFELNKARLERGFTESSVNDLEDPFAGGVIFNFTDPTYSFEFGGYQPVVICINPSGELQYVTEFSYVESPPHIELVKALDFDFENRCFGPIGNNYLPYEGDDLFSIFQENFITCYQSGVFTIEVRELIS